MKKENVDILAFYEVSGFGNSRILKLKHYLNGICFGEVLQDITLNKLWLIKDRVVFSQILNESKSYSIEDKLVISGCAGNDEKYKLDLLNEEENRIYYYLADEIKNEKPSSVG